MTTEIKIKNLPEGYQSIITNGTHSIVGDEPIKSKGTDLGLAPTELVLAGLAMCKVATVRFIARKKGWELKNVHAELSQEVNRGDKRNLLTSVKVAINIEGDISDDQKNELLTQADACYIHRMLDGKWDIETATELNSTNLIEPS